MMFAARTIGLLLMLLLITSGAVLAKPAPPTGLAQILGEFSELEARFEAENWSGADETLTEITEMFVAVKTAYPDTIPVKISDKFIALSKGLARFLAAKEEERVESNYIQLQVVLFDVMNYFDYREHPVVGVLKKYIGDEAREALAKSDFEDVHSELKEVVTFTTKNTAILQHMGVRNDQIQLFLKKIGGTMVEAKNEDATAVSRSLDELERQIDTF